MYVDVPNNSPHIRSRPSQTPVNLLQVLLEKGANANARDYLVQLLVLDGDGSLSDKEAGAVCWSIC